MQLFYAKIEYYASMAFAISAEYKRAKRISQVELSAEEIASSVDEIGVLTPNMETALSSFSRTAKSIGARSKWKKQVVFADLQQRKKLQIAELSDELAAVTAGLRKHSTKDGVYFDKTTGEIQHKGMAVTIEGKKLRTAFDALWNAFPNRIATYEQIYPNANKESLKNRASETVRELRTALMALGLTVENTKREKGVSGYRLAKQKPEKDNL
jgi:hypothetical protein